MLFNMAVDYIVNNRLYMTSIYKEIKVDWKELLEKAITKEESDKLIEKIDRQDNKDMIYFWGRK